MDNFGSEYFKQSMDFQKKMMDQYQQNMEAMSKMAGMPNFAQTNDYFSNSMKMMEKMWDFYGSANKGFEGMKSFMDLFQRTQESNKVYGDMFAFWQELAGAMPLDTPEKIKQYSDKAVDLFTQSAADMLKPIMPEQMQGLTEDFMKFFKTSNDTMQSMVLPWLRDKDYFQNAFTKMSKGEEGAYNEFLEYAFEAYQKSFGKLFNIAGIGPNRDQQEEQFRTMDAYMKFVFEFAEMMSKVADIGQKTSQDVLGKYSEMFTSADGAVDFKDFYTTWIRTNEDAFEKVFATEEFSKLFDSFAKSATDLKIKSDELMENMLSSLPIPTNKTMDGLYKTVYDLRKQVAALEKQVAALQNPPEKK